MAKQAVLEEKGGWKSWWAQAVPIWLTVPSPPFSIFTLHPKTWLQLLSVEIQQLQSKLKFFVNGTLSNSEFLHTRIWSGVVLALAAGWIPSHPQNL
jgi:hypothetical protein